MENKSGGPNLPNNDIPLPGIVLGLRPLTDVIVRMLAAFKAVDKEAAIIYIPMEWTIKLHREMGQAKIERRFLLNGVEFRAADNMFFVLFKGQ